MAQAMLDTSMSKSSRQLSKKLDAIERLRVPLGGEGIPVPGIVVVGNQSAGKSSVLEHISGIQFPRGANTCTKLPTILQMACDPSIEVPSALVSKTADFADATPIELQSVAAEIEKLTKQQTKQGEMIQDAPIYIKVVQNNGPTLCLIDLPGITHIANGKTFDIHDVTSGMVKKYIQAKEMVILCVVPACDDFGTCEAIKLALEVDPAGQRTLGVVTKCDLTPSDTVNADIIEKMKMSRDDDVKLQLGFHAVCNRSPNEIKDAMSASSLAEKEQRLFDTHPVLKHLPRENIGTERLVQRITCIQEKTINEYLPKLAALLKPKLADTKERLRKMKPPCETDEDKFRRFLDIVTKVQAELQELVDAKSYRQQSELQLAPRAYEKMETFKEAVEKDLPDWFSDAMTKKVQDQMREVRGAQLDNFLSHPIFRRLLIEAFDDKLKEQADVLMKGVRTLLGDVGAVLINEHCGEFPRLAEALVEGLQELLDSKQATTLEHVFALIGAETYIFTLSDHYNQSVAHADKMFEPKGSERNSGNAHDSDSSATLQQLFSKDAGVLQQLFNKVASRELAQNVVKMQVSLHSYASVLKTRVYDHIPMVVYRGMVLLSVKALHTYMIQKFGQGDTLKGLMEADPAIVAEREQLQNQLANFSKAMKEIKDLMNNGLIPPQAKL